MDRATYVIYPDERISLTDVVKDTGPGAWTHNSRPVVPFADIEGD
jgi:hypothetical protein